MNFRFRQTRFLKRREIFTKFSVSLNNDNKMPKTLDKKKYILQASGQNSIEIRPSLVYFNNKVANPAIRPSHTVNNIRFIIFFFFFYIYTQNTYKCM